MYRYRTNEMKPMSSSSLKWVINQISLCESELRDRDLEVESYLISDVVNVKKQLNETIKNLITEYKN